jgi:hypothetical protein
MNPRWLVIWALASAVLVLLVERVAPAEPSAAVKAACTADVKRLCAKEYAKRHADGGAGIGVCMKAHAPWPVGSGGISASCIKAWLFEHPEDTPNKGD